MEGMQDGIIRRYSFLVNIGPKASAYLKDKYKSITRSRSIDVGTHLDLEEETSVGSASCMGDDEEIDLNDEEQEEGAQSAKGEEMRSLSCSLRLSQEKRSKRAALLKRLYCSSSHWSSHLSSFKLSATSSPSSSGRQAMMLVCGEEVACT